MGARHSRKSMDVTTTPKKDGLPVEGSDAAAVGDGKLERIEEADVKPTTNGTTPHTDTVEDKDVKDKDSTTEKETENEAEKKVECEKKKSTSKLVFFGWKTPLKKAQEDEEVKVEETKEETPAETAEVETVEPTTPTEVTPASPTSATPDTKDAKKKEKTKKKWSFRSISFSKKDKNKPVREDAPKNGDVTKEEPLTESGEEAENASATSPAEDKSTVVTPTEAEADPATETKEAEKSAPSEEKNEAPSSPTAPTPVPVEASKEEKDKPEKKIESIAEPEPIVEKIKEVITTEILEEAPKIPLPSVEAPVSIAPVAPVITEDVASVTKAIEEIDINEKAVAAAVNENIEAVNTNEIIADMNHQNNMKE